MAKILAKTKDMSVEEWRKLRKGSIGGSDAATILGFNNFSSLYTLYADKLNLISDKLDNEVMRIGRDLEEYVALRFTEATGKKVKRDNHMYIHDDYDFISANIDRRIVGENAGLECKTTNLFNKSDFENGEIPLYYYCQCMHYMAVMGFEKMYLAVLILGKAFYWFEIKRDENEIASLINSEIEFWNNYILTKTPPPVDDSQSTAKTLKELYSEGGQAENIYLGTELEILAKTQTEIKELKKREEKYKNIIIEKLGNNDNGFSEKFIVTYKKQQRSDIDKSRLKKEQPNIYKEYQKTTSLRIMRVKEAN